MQPVVIPSQHVLIPAHHTTIYHLSRMLLTLLSLPTMPILSTSERTTHRLYSPLLTNCLNQQKIHITKPPLHNVKIYGIFSAPKSISINNWPPLHQLWLTLSGGTPWITRWPPYQLFNWHQMNKSLKSSCRPGLLPAHLIPSLPLWLKPVCLQFFHIITAIVKSSLSTATVPPSLKTASITPILKRLGSVLTQLQAHFRHNNLFWACPVQFPT